MTVSIALKNLNQGKHIKTSKSVLEARKSVLQTSLRNGFTSKADYVAELTQINIVLRK